MKLFKKFLFILFVGMTFSTCLAASEGKFGLGPNVAQGQPICLFLDKPAVNNQWDVYGLSGERVAKLSFGPGKACWDHLGIPSGLYWIKIRVNYADGTTVDKTFKVIILR